jgi:methionine aminotransferase
LKLWNPCYKNIQKLPLWWSIWVYHFEEKHISAHTRIKLLNRCVMVSSFGKSFHVTGWKVGYLVAPEYLMKEIKSTSRFSVNSLCQVASEYLMWFRWRHRVCIKRKEITWKLLETSRFTLLPCEGTYFQVAFTLQFLLKMM